MNKLHMALLHAASRLVPANDRAEWLDEWTSELFYVRQAREDYTATDFCLGAFRDAWWLRRHNLNPRTRRILSLETPLQCLSFLAVTAAISMLLAVNLPDARNQFRPTPYPDAASLAIVSTTSARADAPAPLTAENFRQIKDGGGHYFSEMAFYQPMRTTIGTDDGPTQLPVGRASENLFALIGVPVAPANRPMPALVLSRGAWRKYFHSDPHIAGRIVSVAGREAAVAGVISEDQWRLPGRMDAWLLDDRQYASHRVQPAGFVVVRVRSSLGPRKTVSWHIFVPDAHGELECFACTPIEQGHPGAAILAIILLSCLVVPATTTLALGEYPARTHQLPRTVTLRRWAFLAAKIGLVVPIVICGSLDLSTLSHMLEPNALIFGSVLAFRWILTDQRHRCPVCLRLLSNPVRIGRSSQMFLEWYGTELMCRQGHGLLHVPEIATSCYGSQRWLYLDGSWSGLFSQPAGMRH